MLNCNPILPTPLLPPETYLLISSSFSHCTPPPNTKSLQRSNMGSWEYSHGRSTGNYWFPNTICKSDTYSSFLKECFHDAFYDYDEKILCLVMLKAGSGRKQQARIRPLYPAAVYRQSAGSTFQWVPGQCLAPAPRGGSPPVRNCLDLCTEGSLKKTNWSYNHKVESWIPPASFQHFLHEIQTPCIFFFFLLHWV